jgi:hypothetical protein
MCENFDAPSRKFRFNITGQKPPRFQVLPQRCIHVAHREPAYD